LELLLSALALKLKSLASLSGSLELLLRKLVLIPQLELELLEVCGLMLILRL
jgi:hypothetical protein